MKVIRIRQVVGTSSKSAEDAVSQAVAQARALDPSSCGAQVVATELWGDDLDRWRVRVLVASVAHSEQRPRESP